MKRLYIINDVITSCSVRGQTFSFPNIKEIFEWTDAFYGYTIPNYKKLSLSFGFYLNLQSLFMEDGSMRYYDFFGYVPFIKSEMFSYWYSKSELFALSDESIVSTHIFKKPSFDSRNYLVVAVSEGELENEYDELMDMVILER
jgi:hypothetical protein